MKNRSTTDAYWVRILRAANEWDSRCIYPHFIEGGWNIKDGFDETVVPSEEDPDKEDVWLEFYLFPG